MARIRARPVSMVREHAQSVKRPRCELSKQSIQPSRCHSNHQFNQLSNLERLSSPVFAYLCHFLPLTEKVIALPSLSRTLHKLFDIETCCTKDIMLLDLTQPITSKIEQSLFFVPYVGSLTVIDGEHANALTRAALHAAFSHSSLRSLQWADTGSDMATLLSLLETTTCSQMRQLTIHVCKAHVESVNWSSLKRLSLLHSLCVSLPRDPNARCEQLEPLFDAMPSSIQHLAISGRDHAAQAWSTLFRSNTLLPYLETLELNRTCLFSDSLARTVMKTTGQVRPIRSVRMFVSDVEDLMSFSGMTHISLKMTAAQLFRWMEVLPLEMTNLFSFELEILPSSAAIGSKHIFDLDLSPLLVWLACRPLHHLQIYSSCNDIRIVTPCEIPFRALFNMRSLEYVRLWLPSPHSIRKEDLVGIPANHWPNLRVLKLASGHLDDDAVEIILAACPALQVVSLFASPTIIAALGYYCQDIHHVRLSHFPSYPQAVSFDDMAVAFHRFPIIHSALNNLYSLHITAHLSEPAMHFLHSKLANAPKLHWYGHINPMRQAPEESNFAFCLQRPLRHLQALLYLRDNDPIKDIYHRRISTQSDDQPVMSYEFIEHSALDAALSWSPARLSLTAVEWSEQAVMNEIHGWSNTYCRFRKGAREPFFAAVYDELSDEDQQRLAAWDSGDYNWLPTPVDDLPADARVELLDC